ncbi:hypothetical protein PENSPDRAFT_536558, partial [Peniophora sp. CONT]
VDLPRELAERRIHPMFHIEKLRPHIANDDDLFPKRDTKFFYDFGQPDELTWVADEIIGHKWLGRRVELETRWVGGATSWEAVKRVDGTDAFRAYLDLQGVERWQDLPKVKKPVKNSIPLP